MERKGIQFYIDTFFKICTEERKNRYEAHTIAHPYLYRLAKEGSETIFEVLKMAMLEPDFFHRKEASHAFQINLTGHFEHEFNCSFFVPIASREITHSYSPMHTHGPYMISTINAYGEGYNSLIFQKGFNVVDPQTGQVEMKLQKYLRHKPLNIEFMDEDTAHTVFYPREICVTYAFWTHSRPTSKINKLRNLNLVRKNKELIKKIIKRLIPSPSAVGIAVHNEDYFYPKDGKLFKGSGREIQPTINSFPQNFFAVIQEIGFNDLSFLEELKRKLPPSDLNLAGEWIDKFIKGEKIQLNYDGYNTLHPRRNVHIDEYRKVYEFSLEEEYINSFSK
ncbi:MAG: hypothetical protein J0M08_08300 [Bacteroidetes bacterium]|nr:hypothetical protein [Bacteroidota bacterium]